MKLLYDLIIWKFPKTDKNNLALGLAFGLACGLTYGLATGNLAFNLLAGLALGLAFGVAYGLTYGLTNGLTYGLAYGLAFGLCKLLPSEYLLFSIIVIVLGEAIFWLRKEKNLNKKTNLLLHTAWMKFLAIVDSALIVFNLNNIRYIEQKVVLEWFGYIGIAIIGLGIIYGWIYLNSMKYGNNK